jgi:hypothetical protein
MENNSQKTQMVNPVGTDRTKRTVKMKNLDPKRASLLESAVAGVAGVSIGALCMSFIGSPSNATDGVDMEVEVDAATPFSELELESMSFSDAFASARDEMGSGGFFEWHGQTYNTMRADELSAAKADPEVWNEVCIRIDPQHEEATYSTDEEIMDILNDEGSAIAELNILNDNDDLTINDNDVFSDDHLFVINDDSDDDVVLEDNSDDGFEVI